jgi:glutathione S-transferase
VTPRAAVCLVGRSSSHFTRVAAIYAHELGVPYELTVVHDVLDLDAAIYGGHPGLKIPTLRLGNAALFGTENICRRLAELSGRGRDPRLVWPEDVDADVARNAQELTWHAMAAQVQAVIGTVVAKLPASHPFFAKGRAGLQGTLAWLDAQLPQVLDALPKQRELSLLEVTLFCLVEHLGFRPTLPLTPYPKLLEFAAGFATRPSARATPYRFDAPPSPRPERP